MDTHGPAGRLWCRILGIAEFEQEQTEETEVTAHESALMHTNWDEGRGRGVSGGCQRKCAGIDFTMRLEEVIVALMKREFLSQEGRLFTYLPRSQDRKNSLLPCWACLLWVEAFNMR
jgi:hypothetical protein